MRETSQIPNVGVAPRLYLHISASRIALCDSFKNVFVALVERLVAVPDTMEDTL